MENSFRLSRNAGKPRKFRLKSFSLTSYSVRHIIREILTNIRIPVGENRRQKKSEKIEKEWWEMGNGRCCVRCVLWESLASGCTGTSVSFHLNFELLFCGRNSFQTFRVLLLRLLSPFIFVLLELPFAACRCSASSCASTWLEMPFFFFFFYRHKKLCNQLHTSLEIYYVSLEARPPLTRLPWISFSFSFSWFILSLFHVC